MQMSKYVRLTKGLADFGQLINPNDINNYIKDRTADHYVSTYFYTDEHYKQFQKTKSVKGFKNLYTSKVWFDFDSKDNLKLARRDALELINRLEKQNVKPEHLEIYFSGNKGFNVLLSVSKELNKKQVENFAQKLAGDLKTFDSSLYDENQILRVAGTKHQSTDYYKTQLTVDELKSLKFVDLFQKAKKQNETWPTYAANIDDSWFEIKEVEKEIKAQISNEFDLTTKPRNWKASKWALMQGFFKGGERDNSMMVLSATLKAMGYDETQTYSLCKDALKKSWARYGQGNFSKENLWSIIERTFSKKDLGQYSETTDLFLQKKSEELGIRELTQTTTVDIKGALKMFQGYAKHIDELTLKTGIKELDEKQRITVGMSWGIIAGPGSGKTSVALQILHSMSKSGELCLLFSYDMFGPHVIQKIIQTHWKDGDIEEVFEKYKNGDEVYTKKVQELIETEYPNVEFCFESGQTIEDVRVTIREAEQKRSKKCKFIVIDYNELVITDVSDPTQSSNKVAQQVRALASNEQICVLSLFQPSKMTGDPSIEIKSYRAAKGGSGIEQSVSLMFGMSRPGFDPRNPAQDKFVSLNCVKNRMGSIFALDLLWNGYRGLVKSLSATERAELKKLRDDKEKKEAGVKDEDWG